jgi:glycine/D-amino acid oxidase-like deaminating enzyme
LKAQSRPLSRRGLLTGLGLGSAAAALGRRSPASPKRRRAAAKKTRIVVVGAGAFGGFSALALLRGGAQVTLVDSWGPGNSRSSSGGDTRVIRAVYGPDRKAVAMVARSFALWKENEARWKKKLYHRTGALWMVADEGEYVRTAMPLIREAGFAFEELSPEEAAKRFPQIRFEKVRWALLEKEAGYLLARRACEAVVEGFVAEGGDYRQLAVQPGPIAAGRMEALGLSDGTSLAPDAIVFACGPWLPKLFPDVLGSWIRPTRQEVFSFGTPAGDPRFTEERLPVWVDIPRFFYGIPSNERRGFKIADDARGPDFDPTTGERLASAEGLKAAREWLAFRFPALAGAPLLESRVCQYENSADGKFILDRHPAAENVWLAGGGSGHGFKHGPAVGELVAKLVRGEASPDPGFALARFEGKSATAAAPAVPGPRA